MEVAPTALVSPRPPPARAPKAAQSPEPLRTANGSSTAAPSSAAARETPEAIEGIRDISRRLGSFLRQTRIEFDTASSSGDVTITVFDRETNEVIRQIPMENILQSHSFAASNQGLLLSVKV